MSYIIQKVVFEDIGSCKQWCHVQLQWARYAEGGCDLEPRDAEDEVVLPEAVDYSDAVDDFHRYFESLIFIALHSLVEDILSYCI